MHASFPIFRLAPLAIYYALTVFQTGFSLQAQDAATVRFQSLGSYFNARPWATVYVETFDQALGTSAPESGDGTPFPRGWYGTFTATAGVLGAVEFPTAKTNTWCQRGQGIRNFAGRDLYEVKPTANANNQNTYLNRALGSTTRSGVGEDYAGTGATAFGLNLKTRGYTLGSMSLDISSFSINDTRTDPVGEPVVVDMMLNWALQVANQPSGPWATVATVYHATDLGGHTPGGVFGKTLFIPDLNAAVAATGKAVLVDNQDTVFFRLVVTGLTTGAGGNGRASYAVDNFSIECTVLPGFVYNGEDDEVPDPDARFDYIQDFNGLDNTSDNAVFWSQGWTNDGNPSGLYGLRGWYATTTTAGVPDGRFVSGNGYIYTFERSDAGVLGYNPDNSVIYNETGGPPAVVNYGGVSGLDNIANRNIGFRFSHEGSKNANEAFFLGYVYTNSGAAPVTAVEIEFYVPYWQRMGTPAWVRLDFAWKNLGSDFDPAIFRIHEVTGAHRVDEVDTAGNHIGLSYLQFEHKGGLSAGTSYPKNDSQSWTLYGQNMSAQKAGIVHLDPALQPGESLLLMWSTHGNGIDYGAHIVAVDNVKIRYIRNE